MELKESSGFVKSLDKIYIVPDQSGRRACGITLKTQSKKKNEKNKGIWYYKDSNFQIAHSQVWI